MQKMKSGHEAYLHLGGTSHLNIEGLHGLAHHLCQDLLTFLVYKNHLEGVRLIDQVVGLGRVSAMAECSAEIPLVGHHSSKSLDHRTQGLHSFLPTNNLNLSIRHWINLGLFSLSLVSVDMRATTCW